MSAFTLEYSRRGEAPLLCETIEIPNPAAVWCHVEALALRLGRSSGGFIRVRDARGQAVVRTGVATALESIAQCPCGSCELKEIARAGKKFDGLRLSPCRSVGFCGCGAFSAPQINRNPPDRNF
jgi:hypothetical protein